MSDQSGRKLGMGILFSLFATSYTPLFLLIIFKQLSKNYEGLHWGGISSHALLVFAKSFGLSSILIVLATIGWIGVKVFLRNVKKANIPERIREVQVKNVKNKNSDAISYIGTYIIPFLFQDYSGFYEITSFFTLMVVVYVIYVNSTLILINPVLSFKYSLYEVEYSNNLRSNSQYKNGLIIIKYRYLEDDDWILIKDIGHKLFYAEIIKDQVEPYDAPDLPGKAD